MDDLNSYRAKSGSLVPVWTLEIQTLHADVDRILDAVMEVHPLEHGNYRRNARVSGWAEKQRSLKQGLRRCCTSRGSKQVGPRAIQSWS